MKRGTEIGQNVAQSVACPSVFLAHVLRKEGCRINQQETVHVPLRERNKQRVIQRIQEAGFELFRTIGYEQTTMDMIAEKAETSRGTVFKYFPTKGSLWLPFMKQLYVEQVQPQVKVYLNTHPSTLHALQFLFTRVYEHVFQFPEINYALQALQQDVLKTYPRNVDINKDTGFIDMIQMVLQHGQESGDVRLDIPLEKLTQYVTTLYISRIPELLEKNASSAYQLEIETLLAFLHTGLR